MSVFDSRSASVYVTERNDVAYLPHGTDLFPRLVHVTEAVKGALEGEIADLDRARDRFETIPPGTKAFEVLGSLHVATARARFDALASLSDGDRARLDALRAEERRHKAEDPLGRAKERRRCAERLGAVRTRLATLESALHDSAISDLREAHEALSTARAAAALASGEAFADAPLGGVGGEPWRVLWHAAHRFATDGAAPAQPFPPPAGAVDGAVCVLCQQALDAAARARMQRFEEFVRGETRAAVDRAVQELDRRVYALAALTPHTLADATLLEEITSLDAELAAMLTECTAEIARRRDDVVAAARAAGAAADWGPFAYAPRDGQTRLAALEARVAAEAAQYEAAVNPAVRKAAEADLRELEARAALEGLRERVYAEIDRQALKAKLKECVKSANTAAITRRNTEVLRDAVSAPLAEEFARQITALRLTHLPITVDASHGEKGRAFHTLALGKRAGARVPTAEVLSEGEHRCTALAAFFAEVSLQSSRSTVVFDDPVSSLDHARREYVARRIVEIARVRPVLVFTHDLVFVWMLHAAAEEADTPLAPRHFRRDAVGAGLIAEEWPWDGQTVKGRVGALKNDLVALKKLAQQDRPAYEREVRLYYGRLRDTWERSVEELLFNGALRRFSPEVQTLRLRSLHRITEAQMTTFEAGMTKSSKWIQGHDHAAALALSVPEFDEVSADFAALEQWATELRKQNEAKKN